MKFLQNLLASILGFFIALFLIFIFFALVASLVGGGSKVVVEPNSILELDLTTSIKDYAPKDESPLAQALELTNNKLSLDQIMNAIDNAKEDENIKGISVKTLYVNAGMAQTQALRNKLEEFKESGKFVYAYGDFFDQKNYYLSSVADSVFMNPLGAIDFKGLNAEILYYKDFEDKLGVKMEVIRHGKYKSAVEPYLSNKMSEANREQTLSFLNSIWSEITEDISVNRNISVTKLNEIADNSNGRNAELAIKNNLIDGSIYEDEYDAKLGKQVNKDFDMVTLEDYIASGKGRKTSLSKNRIAVIYAQGQIFYGEGTDNIIGQGIINRAIRKAKKNKSVKAIVLRVNSPGGSALASELIWRELQLAKKEKPLVVSMGNVAASGGYYIASMADKIIAEPTTITGSIGVFGTVPNVSKLADKIGINAEQVSTNESANYSLYEPMNKKFYEVTKEGVEQVYTAFLERVADGRNMTLEEADKVAQGRVWTGKEALENGLVDSLGSLEDAITIAADLAKIDEYRVRSYPSYKRDLKETLKLSPFSKTAKEEMVKEVLGDESYEMYKAISQFRNLKGIQARMPYVFEIK